MHVFLQILS